MGKVVREVLDTVWRLALVAVAFTVGVVAGGILPTLVGLQAPPMPEGTDQMTVFAYMLLASVVVALAQSFLARRLPGRFVVRWGVLAAFTWLLHVAMFVEAGIFMEGGGTLFTILLYFVPSVFSAAATAALFRRDGAQKGAFSAAVRRFFSARPAGGWAWRLALVWVAFPLIYIGFGLLVVPLTYAFYEGGAYGLTAPAWGQIIPVQMARSALLIAASLPVVAAWQGSRRGLWAALGFAVWVLIGLEWMITSYWFDPALRIFHSLEVLGDAAVFSGLLVALLVPGAAAEPATHRAPASA